MFPFNRLPARRRLQSLMGSQAVMELAPDGTIRGANARFLSLMGHTLHEIQGKHHRLFVDPAYAGSNAYKQLWEHLKQGKHQTGEIARHSEKDTSANVQISYNPVQGFWGKTTGVIAIAQSMTESKQRDGEFEATLTASR